MTGKITTAVVAAILLGSAGVASAQVGRTGPTYPYYSPYYSGDYWSGIQGVAPYRGRGYDPYYGAYWEGVAPYSN